MSSQRPPRKPRLVDAAVYRMCGAAILTLTLLAIACGPVGSTLSDAPPSILVIVLDACRADHMGCYGYGRDTTPAIDALASDPNSVVYRQHYVQGAWTKSSTASLFTGLFPFQHGVLLGEDMTRLEVRPGEFRVSVLSERFETMAERLSRIGYHTFAVAKSRHLVPALGFDQGFSEYFSAEEISGDRKRIAKTIELLQSVPEPFFGYVHLSGCHHPFPADRRHSAIMAQQGVETAYDEAARQAEGIDFTNSRTKHRILNQGLVLEERDVEFLRLVYDAELRFVDEEHVAPLLAELRTLDRWDDTLIVLTADHGEELYEHRGYGHGHALWDEVIRVPLVVKFPVGSRSQDRARQADAVTQSIDLLPSFLSVAGVEPDPTLPGTDIFGGQPRGFAFSETKNGWMLVLDGFKLIEQRGKTYLFDLASDPGELRNRAADLPVELDRLRGAARALRELVAVRPGEAPSVDLELTPDAIEALRSLGYLQ